MSNWEWKKLGDVCEIKCGATPLKSNGSFWDNGNVPWFTVDDIRNQGRIITETQKKVTEKALKKLTLFPKDTVLLCCTASVGEYALAKIPVTCNQQFNGLIIKNKDYLYFGFLFYFSSTLKEKLLSLSGKTTIDFVSNSKIRELLIPIPPLAEQKRIVKTLDEKISKIDKLKNAAETNLKNAREIFNAKLKSKLNVENENLPQGWEIKTLDEFTINLDSKRKPVTKKNRTKGEFPYYGASGIVDYVDDYIYDGTFLLISEDGANLVARTTPIAFIAEGKFWVNNHAHIIKVENDWTLRFLIRYFEQLDLNPYVKGMAQPKLSQESLYSIQIPLPPLSEQKRIVAHLDNLSEKVKRLEENYRRTIADCEELKKSILKKTFDGDSRSSRE